MPRIRKTLLSILCLSIPTAAFAEAPYSVEDFVKHAIYSGAKISPNGEYLAVSVERGEQDVLTVLRTDDLEVVKINQLPDSKSVGSFSWISPDRLMFNAVKKIGGYAQPAQTGEWFAVNADGSQPRPIIFYGSQGATGRNKTVGNQMFDLLDTLKDDDRNVLMTAYSYRSSEGAGAEVVRMDTFTGRRTSIARAPKENCSFTLDAEKHPRFAVCSSSRNEQGEYEERTELHRLGDDGRWSLVSASASDGYHLKVIHTAPDGTVYAVRSNEEEPGAIGTLDTETGEFTALAQDTDADISNLIWSTDEQSLLAAVSQAGAPKVELIDEDHPDTAIYASLAGSFPGQMVNMSSHTEDGKKIIFSVSSDRNPGDLYLYDRDSGQARFLMSSRQWLDPERMSTTTPFSITSRDGKKLFGYLTIPKDSDGKNLPLIVNPHGGPIGPRDYWYFNPESQLFASRGYAVLQVNYRGSGGYGKGFEDAGHMQWAEGIQNDIIDATNWAVDQGYVDRDRICIYGGSFGGYSALMAPIRAPGLFQCAFGYVGVYDVEMMFNRGDIPERESGLRYLRRTHGTDKAVWARNSPAQRADEVRIPVYLAAGARDMRAPPEQTELMNRNLIAAGNPPEGMIIQSGEMHGFYEVDARVNLYTEMLKFFSRHIGGSATVGDVESAD